MSIKDAVTTWKWVVGILMTMLLAFLTFEANQTSKRFETIEGIDRQSIAERADLRAKYSGTEQSISEMKADIRVIRDLMERHVMGGTGKP